MPLMDGLQTIRKIRSLQEASAGKLPVVLLHSSSDDAELHRESRKLGIDCLLTKPVKSDALLQCLRKISSTDEVAGESDVSDSVGEQKVTNGVAAVDLPAVRILVAEDVLLNMKLIIALLKSAWPGAQVIPAENGVDAVALFEREQPDLILMDVQMPEMDGLEATRRIREMESGSRVPIIALTAAALKEDQEKCLEAGMDSFMSKPVELAKLKILLKTHLGTAVV
jgi:CheY-like chemotaxis protein